MTASPIQTGIETRIVSSLEKVFPDEELGAPPLAGGSMLANEIYAFQLAYRLPAPDPAQAGRPLAARSVLPLPAQSARPLAAPAPTGRPLPAPPVRPLRDVAVRIESPLADRITVREVVPVPSDLPCYPDHDENVLRSVPGLYPDLLRPLYPEGITLVPGQWRALWITVGGSGDLNAGRHPVAVILTGADGSELARGEFTVEVFAERLPEQTLIHTEWLHADCIATWYGVAAFGPEHWRRLEQYIALASSRGVNMILTPLFTPPLDTEIGGERPTVQLVEVEKSGGTYRFGFSQLERWIRMCFSLGIRYIEFSHLFTQWGARHAPKIIARVDGVSVRIFGWETDALGQEYGSFLDAFLPRLLDFVEERGWKDRCVLHVSDEPHLSDLESYRAASDRVRAHARGMRIIDALSNYDFYALGCVRNPVAATDRIDSFLEHGVPDLWAYYCCSQYKQVANRFFGMPSARTRMLGWQLYKFRISGFLHWGFNFYHSQYSRRPVDPYRITDAGMAFPSGDPFLVYPDEEGPLSSIRLEVLSESLQDLRVLQRLEERIGRERTLAWIEEGLDSPLTFSCYPRDPGWLLGKRETLNRLLSAPQRG